MASNTLDKKVLILFWLLGIFLYTSHSAQGATIEHDFWERIQRLYETQGIPFENNPSSWKDCEDKQALQLKLYLNGLPPLHEWKFYPNLLGLGVFNSPEDAREDVSEGRTDAWGNKYNMVLASSRNGKIIWDIFAAILNNVGIPSYNPDLNNQYIMCLKGDIHSQFTDTFRIQNGKAFRILARTLNILGSPGSSKENTYLDSISGSVAKAKCERANVFVGKDDIITKLPSTVEIGSTGGESGLLGLIVKIPLGATPEWYKDVFQVYQVPSGHLLEPGKSSQEKGYFDWMKEILPNPLGKTSVTTQETKQIPESSQSSRHSYSILPVEEEKTTKITTQEYGDWTFGSDPKFPGWLLASLSSKTMNGTSPIYLWQLSDSAEFAARAICDRNDKEYPNEKVNIVIAGKPLDKRIQTLRKALNAAGYDDGNIYFVYDGNLYDSNGTLLKKNYVPEAYCDNPINQSAYAVLRLEKETGLKGYGVIQDATIRTDDSDNNNDDGGSDPNDNDDDDDDDNPPRPIPVPQSSSNGVITGSNNQPPPPPPPPSPPLPVPPLPVSPPSPFLPPTLPVSPQPVPRISNIPPIVPPVYNPMVTPQIGGVLLHQAANVTSNEGVQGDLAGSVFSLIVEGEDAQLDSQTFRKFVTALWAVYYSNEDPGISIDPIAPGAEKHLVRYIGQVINTDLGRVMREADYLMKKWAVGTEKAEIKGFKSPLDYAADAGSLAVGAWSRFWFVPKDMQFRRSGNMLLFEGGKMTVLTEYMFRGFAGVVDPSNKKFADFFTEHYQDIAQKYPVYQELYEYAKMVSLAKYLKESGVPLFWFLMANKDLVITEDSVSTVDALVQNSKQFKGIQVEGGVDLHSEGQYIYDDEALRAVNNALDKLPSKPKETTSLAQAGESKIVNEPFSFALKERSFTVLPQHTSSSGKDYRGMRYQTDFSLKEAGFQLTDRSLAELKWAVFRLKYAELLSQAADKETSENVDLILKESWQKAEALSEKVTGNLKGILNKEFKSKTAFQGELAKYMPKEELANWKDLITQYSSYNTNLELVRWFSSDKSQNGLFGSGWDLLVPYQIKPTGKDVVEYEELILPKRIALVDKLSGREEVLTFNKDRFMAIAYVPDDIKSSRVVGLFIMTDGSFRLLDKIENEYAFDSTGCLTDMIFSETNQIHLSYQKDFEVKLDSAPYKIEKADSNWIEFRGVRVPERLLVKDLAGGKSEELVFSEDNVIVGYIPKSSKDSQFKMLALMSDLSYRLVDQKDNEIVFNQSGEFEKFISTSDVYLVQSMSSGNYTVDFSYTTNKINKPVIYQASLIKDGVSDSTITMQYFYGNDGRLSKVAAKDKNDIKATDTYRTNVALNQFKHLLVSKEN